MVTINSIRLTELARAQSHQLNAKEAEVTLPIATSMGEKPYRLENDSIYSSNLNPTDALQLAQSGVNWGGQPPVRISDIQQLHRQQAELKGVLSKLGQHSPQRAALEARINSLELLKNRAAGEFEQQTGKIILFYDPNDPLNKMADTIDLLEGQLKSLDPQSGKYKALKIRLDALKGQLASDSAGATNISRTDKRYEVVNS